MEGKKPHLDVVVTIRKEDAVPFRIGATIDTATIEHLSFLHIPERYERASVRVKHTFSMLKHLSVEERHQLTFQCFVDISAQRGNEDRRRWKSGGGDNK